MSKLGIFGIGLVAAVVAVVPASIALHSSAKERESALEQRLKATEEALLKAETKFGRTDTRIEALEKRQAENDSRLQKAESVVAEREAKRSEKNAEREELSSNPSKFISSISVSIANRGIINNYSRARDVKLENRSRFAVTDMQGMVEYRTSDGRLVGSAPIKIEGTLLGGQTSTLSASAGEVSGGSDSSASKVVLQSVTVLNN